MNEPDAEAVIKAAADRGRKAAPRVAAPEPVAAPETSPAGLPPVVANPFVNSAGKPLADDGQRVN